MLADTPGDPAHEAARPLPATDAREAFQRNKTQAFPPSKSYMANGHKTKIEQQCVRQKQASFARPRLDPSMPPRRCPPPPPPGGRRILSRARRIQVTWKRILQIRPCRTYAREMAVRLFCRPTRNRCLIRYARNLKATDTQAPPTAVA